MNGLEFKSQVDNNAEWRQKGVGGGHLSAGYRSGEHLYQPSLRLLPLRPFHHLLKLILIPF
jgi:hypothetical protein